MPSTTVRRAVAVTMVAAASLVSLGGAGHAATPGLSAASAAHEAVYLLAGSPTRLVYIRVPVNRNGAPNERQGMVVVRTKAGASHDLPGVKMINFQQWSLSGDWLTAVRTTGGIETAPGKPVPVAWWNLHSGRHGTLTIPGGSDAYLSAAPDGATYMTAKGTIKLVTTSGKHTTLGRAFATMPKSFGEVFYAPSQFASVNATGIVVGGSDGKASYLTFAHPGTVHHLTSALSRPQACTALVGKYAACASLAGTENGLFGAAVSLLPLNATKPTSASDDKSEAFGVGISGSTLIWGTTVNDKPRLASIHAGATTATVGTTPGSGGVSAYGRFVTAYDTAKRIRIEAASSATHLTTLFAVPRS
jgi:hypothetical protein